MRRQINNIFCATDFSDLAADVITYGIALSREFNAKLFICHVVDFPVISGYGEALAEPIVHQNRFMEYARNEIDRLTGDENVEYQTLVTLGNTIDEIVRQVNEYDADLVITATHGRSGLKRLFLGSVTERLMRMLPCPLLVLRESNVEDTGKKPIKKFPFKKVLVGCDFSPDSDMAFNYGLDTAQDFQSELHLVHVVEPSGYKDLFEVPSEPAEKFKQEVFDMVKEKLEGMVPPDALNWITLKTKLMVGKPYMELIRYAEMNDIDLIALGTRGHGMVEEFLVGSTTDRIIRRSPCPVLSIC